jgi:hypothetical protein
LDGIFSQWGSVCVAAICLASKAAEEDQYPLQFLVEVVRALTDHLGHER